MQTSDTDLITLGKITSVYGVRGWVKVYSYTDPMDQILDYERWVLRKDGADRIMTVERGKSHGKGMIAHLQGVEDREGAEALAGYEILVQRSELPSLPEGEFYWSQLEGLKVITVAGVDLGVVDHLISAGKANDVLVVNSTDSADAQSERLIPYLWDDVIKQVDLEQQCITVDWDPEF
ncbi:MAG: ribosome maturation factor RimM [Natronospirillum sp.]